MQCRPCDPVCSLRMPASCDGGIGSRAGRAYDLRRGSRGTVRYNAAAYSACRASPAERVDAPDDGEAPGQPEEAAPVRPAAEAAPQLGPERSGQRSSRILRRRGAMAGSRGWPRRPRHRPAYLPDRPHDAARLLWPRPRVQRAPCRRRLRQRIGLRLAQQRGVRGTRVHDAAPRRPTAGGGAAGLVQRPGLEHVAVRRAGLACTSSSSARTRR